MDGAFARIMEAVHRYEGTVNQFTGDGVMALFGAPIAHEDHAVRAVAAALSVQKAIREYAETLRQSQGLDFALRIGINTGPVVVGRIGDDLRMDYTAQGETVNLAARLQSAAVAGAVLISEATEALVNGYFVTSDAGPRTVKGIDHPVGAFTVHEQRRRRARFEVAIERGLTPLVDRTRDLERLIESVDRARSGRGQVISVVGDAGVGKSRLLYELRRRLHDQPVLCLEGHCLPHGEALPFHEKLRDGFLTATPADELKCPDLELNILQEIVDVTERVNAAVKPDLPADQAWRDNREALLAAIRAAR